MKNTKRSLNPLSLLAGLGVIGVILYWLLSLAISVGAFLVWLDGVIFGFHHSILVGLVSIIPPVGFIEGLLHLLGLI